jgi:hypothetical protein
MNTTTIPELTDDELKEIHGGAGAASTTCITTVDHQCICPTN